MQGHCGACELRAHPAARREGRAARWEDEGGLVGPRTVPQPESHPLDGGPERREGRLRQVYYEDVPPAGGRHRDALREPPDAAAPRSRACVAEDHVVRGEVAGPLHCISPLAGDILSTQMFGQRWGPRGAGTKVSPCTQMPRRERPRLPRVLVHAWGNGALERLVAPRLPAVLRWARKRPKGRYVPVPAVDTKTVTVRVSGW